jgi:hypothetical protein
MLGFDVPRSSIAQFLAELKKRDMPEPLALSAGTRAGHLLQGVINNMWRMPVVGPVSVGSHWGPMSALRDEGDVEQLWDDWPVKRMPPE